MESVSREDLRRSYDLSASDYDGRFSELQRPKHEALLARLPLTPGSRVLDVGCGTGLLARHLSPSVVLVGLDLSIGMLRLARGRLPSCVQGDALALPFRDGVFDAAFAVTSLLVPARTLPIAFLELRRVLVRGGFLALTLLSASVVPGLALDLRACGLAEQETFACGQDTGWILRSR